MGAEDCTNSDYFETVPIILFCVLYGILLIGIIVMFSKYIKERNQTAACSRIRSESSQSAMGCTIPGSDKVEQKFIGHFLQKM